MLLELKTIRQVCIRLVLRTVPPVVCTHHISVAGDVAGDNMKHALMATYNNVNKFATPKVHTVIADLSVKQLKS
jgi:hypothetical protein